MNFAIPGCHCCINKPLVATCHSDGMIYIRNQSNGGIVWSYQTSESTLRNIVFISRSRVALISNQHLWIIDKSGSGGTQFAKIADTAGRNQGGGDFGLGSYGGQLGVYADDDATTNYTGTYNPYIADGDGSQIHVFPCPANSTVGSFQENAFQANVSATFNSSADLYIAGTPDQTTDNDDAIWKLNADGTFGAKFANSKRPVYGLAINNNDEVFAYWAASASIGDNRIGLLDSSLAIDWSVTTNGIPRTLTCRNQSQSIFMRETLTSSPFACVRERAMSDGTEIASYTGTYINSFSQFRVEESSGDLFCGGISSQGLFRIDPSTDTLVWDGYTNSNVVAIDLWYD